MKILHYSLGFPPYRSGGLTKFCIDVMQEQKRIGHDVALLWPGKIKFFRKRVFLKDRGECQGIKSWEIINPLPVSYDEGIIDIEEFTKPCNKSVFIEFLRSYRPDVIHVHTVMGLHKEFIEAAKRLGIKTVFSVHDFFTICPKVTMFRDGTTCKVARSCSECPQCNLTALSMKKIIALQSPLYRKLKDSAILQKLRKQHRDWYLSGESVAVVEQSEKTKRIAEDYKRLRSYYSEILSQVDTIHYNSSLTKEVFEQFFSPKNSKIITISHADIKDNRRIKSFGKRMRLTYLGPIGGAKGFFCSRRLSMSCG